MDLMDRANDRRRTHMRDRLEHKLDDALRDNVRLEQANDLLKAELERDDRERDHMWSAVETGMRGRRRSGRVRRMIIVGAGIGAAYVAGTKAGRSRYDEIVAWFDQMRGRATQMGDDVQRSMTNKAGDMSNDLAGRIEQGAARTSDRLEQGAAKTSDAIEESGHKAADSMRSTTPSTTPGSSTPGSPTSSSTRPSSTTPKG
jgi:cell division septum initiation protein DivIVA